MKSNTQNMRKLRLPDFMTIFSGVMVAVYFFVGLYIMFHPGFNYLPQNIKYIFCFFIFAYGFFRLVRLYVKIKSHSENEDE